MARLLVQLKLRLLAQRAALVHGGQGRVSSSAPSSPCCSRSAPSRCLAALRGQAASVDVTTVVFTVFAFGWLILPIFVFGLDSTLDPATLALYPLRTRPLAVGLLAASATGAWPLANLIGLLGVTVGLARGALGVLVALVAVLLQVLFCITLARFVTTSMAGLLRSRRGKDLAAFLVIPIFAAVRVLHPGGAEAGRRGQADRRRASPVPTHGCAGLPPGLAAHAIQDASSGHPGTALLRLALLAAVIAVLGGLWIRSLSRALVTADTTTQSSAVRGAALPFARYGLRGTVAARFWIYQRREPLSLIYWAMTAVIMVVVAVNTILTPQYLAALVLSAAVGAACIAAFHADSIAMTGPGFFLEAMALTGRRALRAYFSGQNLAVAVIAVPLLTVLSFALAAVAGHPVDGFVGMAVGLAGIGAALALSNIFTSTVAYPLVKRAGFPTPRAADGYGGYSLVNSLGSLVGTLVAISPVVLGAALTRSDPAVFRMPVLVLCAAGYGIALAWTGVRIAARAAGRKLPELGQIANLSTL